MVGTCREYDRNWAYNNLEDAEVRDVHVYSVCGVWKVILCVSSVQRFSDPLMRESVGYWSQRRIERRTDRGSTS